MFAFPYCSVRPEQAHLTWGESPTSSVVVSWASPGPAVGPKLLPNVDNSGTQALPAEQRTYTDGINGKPFLLTTLSWPGSSQGHEMAMS